MLRNDVSADALVLMLRVSRMYYEQGLTQQEIARATRLSRPTISRLLNRAERAGIVQIRILDPVQDAQSLADALAHQFGVREVILADAHGGAEQPPCHRVGRALAECLQSRLRDGMCLGVAWGRTLREMTTALKPAHLAKLTVVQMMGGLAAMEDSVDTTGVAQDVGRILGGKTVRFLAPAFVKDAELRRRILSTPEVRLGMAYLRRLDAAVLGIGAVSPHAPLVEEGYLTPAAMARNKRLGAVGEMLLQFFDARGRPLAKLNRSVVGMSLRDLPRVPLIIAGASGPPDKSEALLGALRGRLVHILVTDIETARRVLARAHGKDAGTRMISSSNTR